MILTVVDSSLCVVMPNAIMRVGCVRRRGIVRDESEQTSARSAWHCRSVREGEHGTRWEENTGIAIPIGLEVPEILSDGWAKLKKKDRRRSSCEPRPY
jgi:hypothetical protein